MSMIAGKYVWIVGASAGIGAELAKKLAEQGARLIVSARNHEALNQLASTLAGSGHIALPLDVMDDASISSAWQSLITHNTLPDMMIYNAGTYEPMSARQFQLGDVEKMVAINFSGVLKVLSHLLPHFMAKNAGHIALVGSVAGYRGLPDAMGYGASKAAIIHLAENLKVDLAKTNIQVQLISPGFVKTRLTDKNNFAMPFIISAEKAADYIVKGLDSNRFEIHFPRRFSVILKCLACLPYALYFPLMRRMNSGK